MLYEPNPLELKSRITYEAFSRFSGSLNKANSIKALARIANENLKYLFDFKQMRILYKEQDQVSIFIFQAGQIKTASGPDAILDYEMKMLQDHLPIMKDVDAGKFTPCLNEILLPDAKLWGWYIPYGTTEVCTSLVADGECPFGYDDTKIVHLFVDCLVLKYQQIRLSERLKKKNGFLKEALREIAEKNEEIRRINDSQQQVITQRTQKILAKNRELLKLSAMSTHHLREPLTRILGLLDLAALYGDNELRGEILEKIHISAVELDDILRRVVLESEKEAAGIIAHT